MPAGEVSAGETRASGIGRRKQRLSDEETQRRMLETASAALVRSGLTVSLEHIRLEDVIREAGVSRSAVYRRWPHKDLFLGDLLLELARASVPMATTGSEEASEIVRRAVLGRLDWLESPAGRQRLLVEILRETAEHDFHLIYGSHEWRTYLALTVTFSSLPEGELREQVQQALATSENGFIARISRSHRIVANLLGLRLRAGPVTFDTVAHLVNAIMRGLIFKALATPEVATGRAEGELFGVGGDWSLAALGITGLITTYFEPDPDAEWDRARIDSLRAALAAGKDLFAPS